MLRPRSPQSLQQIQKPCAREIVVNCLIGSRRNRRTNRRHRKQISRQRTNRISHRFQNLKLSEPWLHLNSSTSRPRIRSRTIDPTLNSCILTITRMHIHYFSRVSAIPNRNVRPSPNTISLILQIDSRIINKNSSIQRIQLGTRIAIQQPLRTNNSITNSRHIRILTGYRGRDNPAPCYQSTIRRYRYNRSAR